MVDVAGIGMRYTRPLGLAVMVQSVAIVNFLLEAGADANLMHKKSEVRG